MKIALVVIDMKYGTCGGGTVSIFSHNVGYFPDVPRIFLGVIITASTGLRSVIHGGIRDQAELISITHCTSRRTSVFSVRWSSTRRGWFFYQVGDIDIRRM